MLIGRVQEANRLRAELSVARMAEKAAREKYQDFMRTSSLYGVSVSNSLPHLYVVASDVVLETKVLVSRRLEDKK